MINLTEQDIQEMHHLYRINLINSCSGYKSANLIGSKSTEGITNLAVFSSVTHIGSNPPLLGFFLRPVTVLRNTYENIKATGVFTINHIYEHITEEAHHTSAKYAPEISEFDVTGLEPCYRDNFEAPFVNGSPVQIAMEYVEEYPIKANDTILVVGKIAALYVEEGLIEKDGFIDLSKAKTAAINGLDTYAVPKTNQRFSYQRPKPEFNKTHD
jgi:flavin reductase (DIM6/NTAB) family NADH-FMN oxidoreductase RutF